MVSTMLTSVINFDSGRDRKGTSNGRAAENLDGRSDSVDDL